MSEEQSPEITKLLECLDAAVKEFGWEVVMEKFINQLSDEDKMTMLALVQANDKK